MYSSNHIVGSLNAAPEVPYRQTAELMDAKEAEARAEMVAKMEAEMRAREEMLRRRPENQHHQMFNLFQQFGTSEDHQRAVAALRPIMLEMLQRIGT